MKVRLSSNTVLQDNGKEYQPGDVLDAPADLARALVAGGSAEIVEEEPAAAEE